MREVLTLEAKRVVRNICEGLGSAGAVSSDDSAGGFKNAGMKSDASGLRLPAVGEDSGGGLFSEPAGSQSEE